MSRPIRLDFNIQALLHNIKTLKKYAGNRFLWIVLKANAYGHKIENLIQFMEDADGIAVIGPDDAVKLRKLGWEKPILLLEGFFEPKEIVHLIDTKALPIVSTLQQIEWLEDYAKCHEDLDLSVYVKVETGMNRLGFKAEQIEQIVGRINLIGDVKVVGIATHFANAELSYPTQSPASICKQVEEFSKVKTKFSRVCLANTAATVFYSDLPGNEVRVGIGLYGVSPDPRIPAEKINLKPTDYFYTKIISLKSISEGDAVGYGSKFIAQRPSIIATLACGYADGYPRTIDRCENAYVFIKGKQARIVGAVAMDMMMVDVTDIPEIQIGDTAELWGDNIKITEVANWAGTIPYDLMCSITSRVPICCI